MKAISPHRSVLLLGITFLIAYIWMQYHFFELRILLDSGVRVFLIAFEKMPDVTEQRALLALNQLLPAICAQLGLSLKTIAITYVLNDAIVYPFFFLLFLFYYKEKASAIALIAGYFVAIKYHFFIIPYSVGLAWPLILWLFLLLRTNGFKIKLLSKSAVLVAAIVALLVFAHPIVAVTTIFIGLHLLVNNNDRSVMRYFSWPIVLFALLMFVKWSDPDPHDMGNVLSIGGKQLGANKANLKFQLLIPVFYPITALVWTFLIGLMLKWLKQLSWRKLYVPFIAISFTIGVYVLYGIYLDYTLGHWMVKTLTPATLLFIFIIAQEIRELPEVNRAKALKLATFIMLPLVFWEFYVIGFKVAPSFTQRRAVIDKIIEQIPNDSTSKFYMDVRQAPEGSYYPLITTSEIAVIAELYHDLQVTPNVVPLTEQNDWLMDSLKADQFYVNLHSFKTCGDHPPYFVLVPGPYQAISGNKLWDTQ